jgi:hypothetical protein
VRHDIDRLCYEEGRVNVPRDSEAERATFLSPLRSPTVVRLQARNELPGGRGETASDDHGAGLQRPLERTRPRLVGEFHGDVEVPGTMRAPYGTAAGAVVGEAGVEPVSNPLIS